jgi:hypothetical protein
MKASIKPKSLLPDISVLRDDEIIGGHKKGTKTDMIIVPQNNRTVS